MLAAAVGPFPWSLATVVRPHSGPSLAAGPVRAALLAPLGKTAVPAGAPRRHWRCSAPTPTAFTWTAAAVGHRADDLQLAVGTPVMPVGGFAGDDPRRRSPRFQAYVAASRVHWYVGRQPRVGTGGARSTPGCGPRAPLVHAGKTTLYDLSAARTAR